MTVDELLGLIADALGPDGARIVDVEDLDELLQVLALANPDLTAH